MRTGRPSLGLASHSGGEQPIGDVLERLELERVAGRIEQEHRRLFARPAAKSNRRLDHELDAVTAKAIRKRAPIVELEHDAVVRYRHALPVDRIVEGVDLARPTEIRIEVAHDLVAEQVEVHPVDIAAPLRATDDVAVKR